MKLFLLLFLPILSSAQHFSITPNIGLANTALLNPEDKVGISYVPPIVSYSPSIGADITYQFTQKNKGFASINTGIYYLPITQNYKDRGDIPNTVSAILKINLNYIQVPLQIKYQYPIGKKIDLFAKAGIGFNFLTYYKVYYKVINYITSGLPQTAEYGVIINNNTYNKTLAGQPLNSTLDKWFYKKFVLSSLFNIGGNYAVSKKINIIASMNYSYSFNDIENKTNITNTVTNGFYTGLQTTENPYEKYFCYLGSRAYFPKTARLATHIQSIGMQLGIQYNF
jgi:Outer membrane protein beta-barrel domain